MERPYSAHVDTFARDHLPPHADWPTMRFELPELRYPDRINCGTKLLDDAVVEGHGGRVALYSDAGNWTYGELLERANWISNVLIQEQGIVPGNRVLLFGANCPLLYAAWLRVVKAGAIAVTAMPMLRAKEIGQIATKEEIHLGLSDARLLGEMAGASAATGFLENTLSWGDGKLERAMARRPMSFVNVDTARDDVCLLAFTSGTTGTPKATMHFNRDVLAMADVVGRHLLETDVDDIYVGSPPLGFTFGLGALLVFPLRFRAAVVVVERPTPEALLAAIARYRATCVFTAPTLYKSLVNLTANHDLSSLTRRIRR